MVWKSHRGSNLPGWWWRHPGPRGAKWAMSYLGKPIQCRVEEFLQQYSQLPYICRCNDKIHAYHLGISGIVCEELHAIWLETYVLPPVVCLTQHSDCNCVDKHLKAVIKMDKQTKNHIVEGASSIFVANALIGDFKGLPLLDVHHAQGIVIRDFQSRERHDSITTAEMCAGGFAGWLHASSVCCIRGPKLKPLFAVEWEQEISDTYCKNWKDAQQIRSLESYHRDMQPDRYPLFVEDIQMGWWLQCIGKSFWDIMFLSAPCQPWSSASIGKGLLSEDGWSSLVALVIAAYLRPKAVGWEQVAGIQKHRHWPILKSVAKRCGFDVVLESKCNLAEISPQNRERLLVLLLDSNLGSTLPLMVQHWICIWMRSSFQEIKRVKGGRLTWCLIGWDKGAMDLDVSWQVTPVNMKLTFINCVKRVCMVHCFMIKDALDSFQDQSVQFSWCHALRLSFHVVENCIWKSWEMQLPQHMRHFFLEVSCKF